MGIVSLSLSLSLSLTAALALWGWPPITCPRPFLLVVPRRIGFGPLTPPRPLRDPLRGGGLGCLRTRAMTPAHPSFSLRDGITFR